MTTKANDGWKVEWRDTRTVIVEDGDVVAIACGSSTEKRLARAEQIVRDHRLAALVPGLVDGLRFLKDTAFALHVNDQHKPEAFSSCEHHICQRACKVWNETMEAVNAVAKEREG